MLATRVCTGVRSSAASEVYKVQFFGNLVDWLDFLQGFFGNASFELGTEVSSFSFTHLVLFRVGRPQKPALFINKALAPFRGATSDATENRKSIRRQAKTS